MIVIDFNSISWDFMDFKGPRLAGCGGLWDGRGAPTRKNVGFLNPSKEQGARLDLSSLA